MSSSVRVFRALHLATLGVLFWLAMQAFHELGHVLGAFLTGAEVHRVVLHPFRLSETLLGRNPAPAFVAFSGLLGGVLIPLLAYGTARLMPVSFPYRLRAFSGFCLVANGVYLVFGPSSGLADTGILFEAGWSEGLLRAIGIGSCGAGIYLWDGLGRYLGIGTAAGPVRKSALGVPLFLLASLLLLELMFQP